MEKYTVDIDKVLDEFEQSEALEVCQEQQASKCSLTRDSSSDDFRNILVSNEQSQNHQICNQPTDLATLYLQQKSNIFCEKSSLQNINTESLQDSTKIDQISFYGCNSELPKSSNSHVQVESTKHLNLQGQPIENKEQDFKNCYDSNIGSSANADSHNSDEKSSVSLQTSNDSDGNAANAMDFANKHAESLNVCEFVTAVDNENSFHAEHISTDLYPVKQDFIASLTSDRERSIEATFSDITEEEERMKTGSIDTSQKIHIETGTSNEIIHRTVVGFSENSDEPDLSIQEMDEYLNDLNNSDNGQDEDSGVSSQEEINGNNITLSNSECELKKCNSHILDHTNGNSHQLHLPYSEQLELDAKSVSNPIIPDNVPETADDEPLNCSDTKAASQCSPSTESSKSEKFIENTDIFNSKTEEINLNFSSDIEPMEVHQSSHCLSEDKNDPHKIIDKTAECIEDSNSQQQIPEMKLVFSPNDGTFRSVPFSDMEISNNLLTSNNNFVYDSHCEEIIAAQCNMSYNSRLQRPTTLNLTGHNVGTATIVTSCTDLPASLQGPAEEVPASNPLIDASHMDSSEAEAPPSKLGTVKPFWIPDSEASNCMHCDIKFTVIKRRHHCRACGKVLCSRCCSQKARLPYLFNKEDRVCQQCIEHLNLIETERDKEDGEKGDSPIPSSCGSSPSFSQSSVSSSLPPKDCWRPHPNNPDDYCSTVSPLQQVEELANRPPPTVMVPVGVLKRDGIRPGGDLTDLTETVDVISPSCRHAKRRDKFSIGEEAYLNSCSEAPKKKVYNQKSRNKRIVMSDNNGPLPPIILPDDSVDRTYDLSLLFSKLQDDVAAPVIFAITKNLHVWVKITKLDCCFGKECWCFTSHGLCTVGQDEVLLLLERFQDEDIVPRDVFKVFNKIYEDAGKGVTVGELGHLIFPDGIFGSWEHRGFLFVRPTFQCLSKLVLPSTPYLFAILIQKWEVPWAKVFPLRLMLRLGAECRYYPCSLVSIRFRKPVYFEIGQTIMSLLADLRNFQFTIPFIPGLVVHMEEKKTYVNIPKNRYEKLMKVLNSNNVEHVLALGCNFSPEADSHLVCMQREEGDYQAQAINIEHTTRKVTGASFIVFSEALKSSTGLAAKFKIVEDGLLVEIPQETMVLLHSALRDMRDLTIQCKQINSSDPEEIVIVQWTSDDRKFNIGVISPVDKRSLEGTSSLRIHTSTDYAGSSYLIRWTEVFFLDGEKIANNRRLDAVDPCRLAETVAQAFCMALIPYLDSLAEVKMTKLGLRITLDSKKDMVEYEVGSLGQNLPAMYMNALDNSLIPVLSRITLANQDDPVALELIFYILTK